MNGTITMPSADIGKQAEKTVSHFLSATLTLLFALLVLIAVQKTPSFAWAVSLLAIGFVGAGAVAGFLYSTYGDEEKTFSPAVAAVTTALGGATLADGVNREGILRHIYHALGNSAGLESTSHGIVIVLAAVFTPLGFFTLYFYRRLVVNRLVRTGDAIEAREREADRSTLVQAGEIKLDATSGAGVFQSDPATRAAAEEWLKQQPPVMPSFDDLLGDARAQIALGKHAEAIKALEKALRLRPGNPPASLLLAAAQVANGEYTLAVDLLESIIRNDPGQVPLNAWKLLGYARLFHDPASPDYRASLMRSIDASSKFFNIVSDDLGVLLNRACAYGQLGPSDPRIRSVLFTDLKTLFEEAPEAREHVRSLIGEGLDFALWANDDEFRKLLGFE